MRSSRRVTPVSSVEFGREQLRREVVGGVVSPPVDVVGERLGDRVDVDRLPLPRVVEALAYSFASVDRGDVVGFGDPQQHADDQHGNDRAEVVDEVEATRSDVAVECPGAVLADRGSIAAIAFGVKTRDKRPRWTSCSGGSSKRTMPGGNSIPDLMSSRIVPLAEE